jgi:hypothetical protein
MDGVRARVGEDTHRVAAGLVLVVIVKTIVVGAPMYPHETELGRFANKRCLPVKRLGFDCCSFVGFSCQDVAILFSV